MHFPASNGIQCVAQSNSLNKNLIKMIRFNEKEKN
jgi:hypothetical protein